MTPPATITEKVRPQGESGTVTLDLNTVQLINHFQPYYAASLNGLFDGVCCNILHRSSE